MSMFNIKIFGLPVTIDQKQVTYRNFLVSWAMVCTRGTISTNQLMINLFIGL